MTRNDVMYGLLKRQYIALRRGPQCEPYGDWHALNRPCSVSAFWRFDFL